ncbi:MAG TPA: BCCT family transporter [Selenomonadales bacterium]|nr:BCCT family transporter [Selenomonadales bacterium]
MSSEKTVGKEEKKGQLRPGVFIPSFIIVGGSAILGLVNNELLTAGAAAVFKWSLINFAWIYQIVAIFTLAVISVLMFSKLGKIRLGGPRARAKYSFSSYFAMTLTAGIATGLITYGVNEPIIYFGNIYGELKATGIQPLSTEAAFFAMGRVFYNWSFVPYAMYALSGVLISYLCFNRGKELSISASLTPLFGEKVTTGIWRIIIDALSVLAMILGLASSLGAGLALIGSGLHAAYGIPVGPILWFVLTGVITVIFITSSVKGIEKGIKWLADLTSKVFYALVLALFFIGPTIYILSIMNVGMGYWLDRFWTWGLDPYLVGGEALVTWWTMYDWAIWIAYAPLMGIFFAMISYGRTIRQFLMVNWIGPSIFSILWLSIWGGTALDWQMSGKVDIIAAINKGGAVAGIWEFLNNVPLSALFIPIVIICLIGEFANTANGMTTTISALCSKGLRHDDEPATWLKVLWGVTIGTIAAVMVAFGGGVQGVDGVKYLAACGGSAILFVFILQIASAFKLFFLDKETVKEAVDSEDLLEAPQEFNAKEIKA